MSVVSPCCAITACCLSHAGGGCPTCRSAQRLQEHTRSILGAYQEHTLPEGLRGSDPLVGASEGLALIRSRCEARPAIPKRELFPVLRFVAGAFGSKRSKRGLPWWPYLDILWHLRKELCNSLKKRRFHQIIQIVSEQKQRQEIVPTQSRFDVEVPCNQERLRGSHDGMVESQNHLRERTFLICTIIHSR